MFPRLLEPIDLGALRLRNRVVMSPMATGFATAEGAVTPQLVRYYEARARGGVGLVLVEGTMPQGELRYGRCSASLHADDLVPGWAELTTAIHRHGALAGIQLLHPGRQMLRHSLGPVVAPSAVPLKTTGIVPRPLTASEIHEIVEAYGRAAARARAAGFDTVELHASHGYLIAQFLSPISNRREDAYGGDLAGRARFLLEVLASVRRHAGADFPVLCRLAVDEFLPGGITLEASLELVPWLEEAGVVAIRVSGGNDDQPEPVMIPPLNLPRGHFWRLSEAVQRVARVPTDVAGRIDAPEIAERLLAEGTADFVSVGRALIADPDWVRKAETGRGGRIRPCIYTNQGCIDRLLGPQHGRITCVVNPEVGHEAERRDDPAARRRRVVVAGGGPAGLQAALAAARRGHAVTLLERERLGGRMTLAARAPGMGELARAVEHLTQELEALGVDIRVGREATVEAIAALEPEAVIVATGARGVLPSGLAPAGPWRSVEAVLAGDLPRGSRAVVVGGRQGGLLVAERLAEAGYAVTVVDADEKLGRGFGPATIRWFVRQRLETRGVRLMPRTRVAGIEPGAVRIDGAADPLPADLIVVELRYEPDDALAHALAARSIPAAAAGDCRQPGSYLEAFHEGDEAGRAV